MVKVTRHATKRTRQRLGLPKRASIRNAERALQNGIRHTEARGSLKRYMTDLFLKYKIANNIRIFCGTVYIFQCEKLITLFPLPQKYRKTAEYLKKKKEAQQTTSRRIIRLLNDEVMNVSLQAEPQNNYCICYYSELLLG